MGEPPTPGFLTFWRGPGSRLLAVAGAAAFLLLALWRIDLPGLYYDELLFVPAALQITDDCGIDAEVSTRVGCVPILLQPFYLGALKAQLYSAVFALVPPSPASIRLPALVLMGLSLVVLALFVRRRFGFVAAAVLFLLLASDPVLVFHARVDWGPFVLGAVFRSAALMLFLIWTETGRPWPLALAGLACLLGIYDKLNFVWIVAAFGLAAPLVYLPELRAAHRRHPQAHRALAAVMAVALLLVAVFLVMPALRLNLHPGPFDLAAQVGRVLAVLQSTFDGRSVYQSYFGQPLPYAFDVSRTLLPVQAGVGSLVTLAVLALAWSGRLPERLRKTGKAFAFLHLTLLAIVAEMMLTKDVGGSHHGVVLIPFLHLHLVLLGVLAVQLVAPAGFLPSAAVRGGVAVVAGLVLVEHASLGTAFLQALTPDGTYSANTTPAIYDLAKEVGRDDAGKVVSVDWGLHQQLVALAPAGTRGRYFNFWYGFLNPPDPARPVNPVALVLGWNREVLFVARDPAVANFPATWERLQSALAESKACILKDWTVKDAHGRDAYHLIRVGAGCPHG